MIVFFLLNPNSGTFPNIGYIKGIYPLALNVNFEMMTRDNVAFLFHWIYKRDISYNIKC